MSGNFIGDIFGGGLGLIGDANAMNEAGLGSPFSGTSTYGVDPNNIFWQYAESLQGLSDKYGGLAGGPATNQYTAEQQGQSALASVDPSTRSAQMKALAGLGNEVDAKGLTADDQLALNQSIEAAGRNEAGTRGAAQQRQAARGMGGSMSSYLADLQGGQATSNQVSNNALQTAADNRDRYLKALGQLGSQAGAVRGQDYTAASAQDSINAFNANMRWRAQQGNNQLAQQQWKDQYDVTNSQTQLEKEAAQQKIDAWKAKTGLVSKAASDTGQYGNGWGSIMQSALGGM